MGIRWLKNGCLGLLLMVVVACEAPDARKQAAAEPVTSQPADTTKLRAGVIVDPVLPPCYSVRLPNEDSVPPLVLHRRFTGLLVIAAQVDTARQQLSAFNLKAAVLYPADKGSVVRLAFESGKPVPDSLASLLPLLEQHIRALRPQVVVAREGQLKAEQYSCEMPAEWIFPIRIR